ncbi:hypothetical protein FPRO04_11420 [Fusarium proliferatum]|nr:hypothetical protein FPRO04_11420 [Fusarium proliferatum]
MGINEFIPTFIYIIQQLRALNVGFLDLIEERIRGNVNADCGRDNNVSFAVHAWGKQAPVMISGGFNGESAQKAVDETYKDYKLAIALVADEQPLSALPYEGEHSTCQI